MAGTSIIPLSQEHWDSVAVIYADGMATGDATFEKTVPAWEAWDAAHRKDCRLVAIDASGQVTAWGALSNVSGRCVYAGVAEVSVYVSVAHRRKGIGGLMLSNLIDASEHAGIWTLQAGIFPENQASLRMHQACGFRIVGVREKLGQLDGRWRDVVLLERRSTVAKMN